jgi:hypothetical protein
VPSAIVSGLSRGPHTVGMEVGADIFSGGVPGNSTELEIHKANFVIRVYRD